MLLKKLILLAILSLNIQTAKATENDSHQPNSYPSIVTLSPHLTEIVFALGLGSNIIAVSDYSDYPKEALKYPSVASYQGANLAEIYRLNPSHILVWKGGNKGSDIEKLKNDDYLVYESSIYTFDDLLKNISEIGEFLNATNEAQRLVEVVTKEVENLLASNPLPVDAIYYLNAQPLVGLGNDPWLNNLLSMCNIKNVYKDSNSAYPQLKMSDVLRKNPEIIISANYQTIEQVNKYWNVHRDILDGQVFTVNPDALHRFTPRAILELSTLCNKVQQSKHPLKSFN